MVNNYNLGREKERGRLVYQVEEGTRRSAIYESRGGEPRNFNGPPPSFQARSHHLRNPYDGRPLPHTRPLPRSEERVSSVFQSSNQPNSYAPLRSLKGYQAERGQAHHSRSDKRSEGDRKRDQERNLSIDRELWKDIDFICHIEKLYPREQNYQLKKSIEGYSFVKGLEIVVNKLCHSKYGFNEAIAADLLKLKSHSGLEWQLKKDFFSKINLSNLQAKGFIIVTMLEQCRLNKDHQFLQEVLKITKEYNILNSHVLNTYIKIEEKIGSIENTREAFKLAIRKNVANNFVYNTYIKAEGERGDIRLAREAFNKTVEKHLADNVTYNIYIDLEGKRGDIRLAREAFYEVIKKHLADSFTYATYIDMEGERGDIRLARKAFNEAIKKHLANNVTYNTYIKLEGEKGDIELAREALNEAIKKRLATGVIYATYIKLEGERGDIELARKAFNEAIKKNLAASVTYNTYIDIEGNIELAREAFNAVTEKNLADSVTYATYIKVEGERGDIELARKAFNKAIEKHLASSVTYATYIKAEGERGDIELVRETFNKAIKKDLASSVTYNTYIKVEGERGDIKLAHKAFNKAIERHLFDSVTYNTYIKAEGEKGDIRLAREAFSKAIEENLADSVTYANYIKVEGEKGDIELVREAFNKTVEKNFATSVTYNIYIKAEGEKGDIRLAREAFNAAIEKDLASSVTYTTYIKVEGERGDIELARKAFDIAIKKDLASIATYATYIKVEGERGDVELARKAFNEAIEKDLADNVTYNTYIKAEGEKGDITNAREAFQQAERNNLANYITFYHYINAELKHSNLIEAEAAFNEALRRNFFNYTFEEFKKAREISHPSITDSESSKNSIDAMQIDSIQHNSSNEVASNLANTFDIDGEPIDIFDSDGKLMDVNGESELSSISSRESTISFLNLPNETPAVITDIEMQDAYSTQVMSPSLAAKGILFTKSKRENKTFESAWKTIKDIISTDADIIESMKLTGGLWPFHLLKEEKLGTQIAQKMHLEKKDPVEKEVILGYVKALLQYLSFPVNTVRSKSSDIHPAIYLGIVEAKLKEAKWRVQQEESQPVIYNTNCQVPTLILYKDQAGIRAHACMIGFDSQGIMQGIAAQDKEKETALAKKLEISLDRPLSYAAAMYLQANLYRGNQNKNHMNFLILCSAEVEKDLKHSTLDTGLQARSASGQQQEGMDTDISDIRQWVKQNKQAANQIKNAAFQANLLQERAYALKYDKSLLSEPIQENSHVLKHLKLYQQETVLLANRLRSVGYKGAIGADQMGLGKTIQAVAWAFFNLNSNPQTILSVSPKSLRTQSFRAFTKYWQEFQITQIKSTAVELLRSFDSESNGQAILNLKKSIYVLSRRNKSAHRSYQNQAQALEKRLLKPLKGFDLNTLEQQRNEEFKAVNKSVNLLKAAQNRHQQREKQYQDFQAELQKLTGHIDSFLNNHKVSATTTSTPINSPLFQHIDDLFLYPKNREELQAALSELANKVDQPAQVVFATFPQLEQVKEDLKKVRFGSVIVDEAHLASDITSSLSKTLKGIKKDFMMLFTGTPYRNRLEDLLGLLTLLDMASPQLAQADIQTIVDGSNCLINAAFRQETSPAQLEELALYLADSYACAKKIKEAWGQIMARHDRDQVRPQWEGCIPTKSVSEMPCQLTSKQQRLIKELDSPLDRSPEGSNFLKRHWKYQRILIHPDLNEQSYEQLNQEISNRSSRQLLKWAEESGLLKRFLNGPELKAALDSKEPIIIYADQLPVCRLLQACLAAKLKLNLGDVPLYSGEIQEESERDRLIQQFKRPLDDKPRLIVLSRGVGGVGLDLNARHVFIMERGFEPFDDQQLEDRSVRVNQTGHVNIWYPNSFTEYEQHLKFIREQKEKGANYFLSQPQEASSNPIQEYQDFLEMLYSLRKHQHNEKINANSWEAVKQGLTFIQEKCLSHLSQSPR